MGSNPASPTNERGPGVVPRGLVLVCTDCWFLEFQTVCQAATVELVGVLVVGVGGGVGVVQLVVTQAWYAA